MRDFDKVILYQAYGPTEIYKQVYFSLLTLYYHLDGDFSGIRIVIYTDSPSFFEPYVDKMPIILEPLTDDLIESFKGKLGFVHRVKIGIIQSSFKKFRSDILYLDSDTYFTRSPKQLLAGISKGNSIMNTNDYDLEKADKLFENLDWLAIRRVVRDYEYVLNGEALQIPLATRMWNAGVIGISVEDSGLLDQVLSLTDQIYGNEKVFTAEQFAFSYILQKHTTLVTSGDVIFHYWPNFIPMLWKQIYNHHINVLYKKSHSISIKDQAKAAIALTCHHETLQLPGRTLLGRIVDRLKLIGRVAVTGRVEE